MEARDNGTAWGNFNSYCNAALVLEVKYIYTPSPVVVNASPFRDTNFNLKIWQIILYLAEREKQSMEPNWVRNHKIPEMENMFLIAYFTPTLMSVCDGWCDRIILTKF